jgi:hypothetical protein
MASRGKKKTTMAKLSRESRLRERRLEKEARKVARRQGVTSQLPEDTWQTPESDGPSLGESTAPDAPSM